MHDVGDVQQQAAAEAAGRVRAGEIVGGEAACVEQGHGQRIAHRQRGGGAGGRRQRQRAGLGRHADVQVDIGGGGQAGLRAAGHGDQQVALALEHRQQHEQLVRLPRIGQRQHHIVLGDHAQVTVSGLARVHVERRGAGGGQGGGDLAGDVPGFAHAGGHHTPAAGQDRLAGLLEGLAEAVSHGLQCLPLDLEHAAATGDQAGRVGRTGGQQGFGHADATQRK